MQSSATRHRSAAGSSLQSVMRSHLSLLALLVVLAGCSGPQAPDPTAIPADVVRPAQSTPEYPNEASVFTVRTPSAEPILVTPAATAEDAAALSAVANGPAGWTALLAVEQPPSAVGIARGGAAIYAEPGGSVLRRIGAGGVLNVTGKSADERWVSVYTDDGVFGWTPASQLLLYGDDDLVVVERAPDPGAVATLIAQAMEPVSVLDDLMATLAATPSPSPTVTPTPR
ncbi:MAG: SH3 domain-containing protein [Caldilineaceae bacterium]|nr:SH3 domain-containing protein [Caldilineaceae bacterium]